MSEETFEKLTDEQHFDRHLKSIINLIETKHEVPWARPWRVGQDRVANLASGRAYTGISNIILLSFAGFSSPWWVTKRKCEEFGGHIKENETPEYVFYWHRHGYEHTDENTGEVRKGVTFYPRTHEVYNVEQTEGITHYRLVVPDKTVHDTLPAFENLLEEYCSGKGPKLKIGGNRAFYRPSDDSIEMPEMGNYDSYPMYCHTGLHEMGHSTGHSSRLNRKSVTKVNTNDQEMYGREELIAELCASYMMSVLGFTEDELKGCVDNSVAYIQSWSKVIKDDPKMFITAGQQAEKAAKFIISSVSEAVPF